MKQPALLSNVILPALAAILAAGAGPSVQAQMPGKAQPGLNAALLWLLRDVPAFSAKAEVQMRERGAAQGTIMMLDFAMRQRQVRIDLDVTRIQSRDLPASLVAVLKQAGMERMTTVLQPDRRRMLVLYPAIRSYVEVPMEGDEGAEFHRHFKIEKKLLAREKIDKHPCEKHQVVLTADNGERHEAIVWYATDLKMFPIKVQLEQKDATVVVHYRDVRQTSPDAQQFEAPGGFTRYPDADQLRQAALSRALGAKK